MLPKRTCVQVDAATDALTYSTDAQGSDDGGAAELAELRQRVKELSAAADQAPRLERVRCQQGQRCETQSYE